MSKAETTPCQHGMAPCPYCAKAAAKRSGGKSAKRTVGVNGADQVGPTVYRVNGVKVKSLKPEPEWAGSPRDGEPVAPQDRRELYREASALATLVEECRIGLDR